MGRGRGAGSTRVGSAPRLVQAALALLFSSPLPAGATYSIVAVDTERGAVGGAGTSCVGRFSVSVIYGAVPGRGVVHAQALYNEAGRDRAVLRLEQGFAPEAILSEIIAPAFDADAPRRQYAIIDVEARVAAFTGAENGVWAGDHQGAVGAYAYSVQGNLLTGPRVLEQASLGFEEEACDLAERLMRALETGAEDGEGDRRCTPEGIPSDGAFIAVEMPGSAPGSFLSLRVDNTAPADPIALLRSSFDEWRLTHTCPSGGGPSADGSDPRPDAAPQGDASMSDGAAPEAEAGVDGDAAIPDTPSRSRDCRCEGGAPRARSGVAWIVLAILWPLRPRARARAE